jgi:hypothetical protein
MSGGMYRSMCGDRRCCRNKKLIIDIDRHFVRFKKEEFQKMTSGMLQVCYCAMVFNTSFTHWEVNEIHPVPKKGAVIPYKL